MSTSPVTSLAPLSAANALQAASGLRAAVKAARAAEREKWIVYILLHHRVWAGWFRRRPCTSAEAEALADRPHHTVGWDEPVYRSTWWQIAGGGSVTLAERLEAAAQHSADGTVWLNLAEFQEATSHLSVPQPQPSTPITP